MGNTTVEKNTILIPQTPEEVQDILSKLPEQFVRKYEETIVGYSTNWPPELMESTFEIMKGKAFRGELKNEKVYFALYATLVNRARRMKNRSREKALLAQYCSLFKEKHIFYDHLCLLENLENVYSMSAEERLQMVELAKKNEKQLAENAGGSHALAEAVALVYEIDDVSENPSFQKQRKDWLAMAERAVEKAVEEHRTYAKFYCTYARLQSLLGQYEKALSNIAKAIDLEDEKKDDYAIRIGGYESRGQQIRAKMQMEAIEKESRAAMEDLEKQSMVKNMEFLGLFSGIVSFTIGSLTISGAIADQSIQSAAGLIVVLMGALMGVFAGFGIILHGWGKGKAVRNLIVLILGLAIVLGGIYLCLDLPIPFLNLGMH